MLKQSNVLALGVFVSFFVVSCSKESTIQNVSAEVLTTESSSTNVNLSSGLIAYYPFSGNVNDASGNKLNGINYGAILTKDRTGSNNKAYRFNGTSYIDFKNDPRLDPASNSVYTVSVWYRSTAPNPGAIISKYWNGYANLSSFMIIAGVNNMLQLSGNGTSVLNSSIVSTSWTHIVGEFHNNTGTAILYLNGKIYNSGTLVFNATPNNTPLTVGRVTSIPGYEDFFIGDIDDVRIYKRVLNVKEIEYLSKH